MTPARLVLLAGAAAVAGAINSVAGGGSLVSFPAAIAAGLPPLVANATNTVALTPGSLASAWAYRRELAAHRRTAAVMAAPATLGGWLGMKLLLATPPALFSALVPWLVFGATALVAMQDAISRWRRREQAREPSVPLAIGAQLAVAIYGGYFGAGMGILMLALFVLLAPMSIHEMNALKSVLAALINGVAAVGFVVSGVVEAEAAAVMAVGAIAGGFAGARLARRAPARIVRRLVLVIGFGLSAILAARRWCGA